MIPIDPWKIIGSVANLGATTFEKVGKKGIDVLASATDKMVDGSIKSGAGKIKNIASAGASKAKGIGKIAGKHILDEAKFAGNTAAYAKDALLGEAPLSSGLFGYNSKPANFFKKTALMRRTDKNMLGVEFTGLGKGAFVAGALAVGTKDAVQDFSHSRVGVNDGTMYTNTPRVEFGGQTFQSMGASYANNGGATGDLGFALHNQRRTGLF